MRWYYGYILLYYIFLIEKYKILFTINEINFKIYETINWKRIVNAN
jgi:hypothetical protein